MDNASAATLRAALTDQLAYLLLELASTESVLPRMAKSERIDAQDGLTVRQRYGAIAEHDADRTLPRLRALAGANGTPDEAEVTDWNILALPEVLRRVAANRRTLLAAADGLGELAQPQLEELCRLLHRTVQHDTVQLQAIAKQCSA
ncbi:MAG: hypothetical protein OXI38_11485 [Bacteroidota bacterium]|nr:hypothetical protein [Bacteroidota bacterium]